MANYMSINYLTAVPTSGLKPYSIYIIQPVGGNYPQVFITDQTGSNKWQINPSVDLSAFVKTVNGIPRDSNGNVQMDLSFANGILSLAGSGVNIDLDARYVNESDFQSYKNITDARLASLESVVLEGLKTPVPFDATQFPGGFPTQERGFQYKVTVAGTVSGQHLEIGDVIIYDTTGNTPFVLQTNVDQATTTLRGLVRIATQIEVDNGLDTSAVVVSSTLHTKLLNVINGRIASTQEVYDGNDDVKFVTPLKNKQYWANKKASQATVNAGTDDEQYITSLKLETRIAAALSQVHSHTNLPVLEKFTEGPNGEIKYNGFPIYTLGDQQW